MMPLRRRLHGLLVCLGIGFVFAIAMAGCGSGQAPAAPKEKDATPPADSMQREGSLFLTLPTALLTFHDFKASGLWGAASQLAAVPLTCPCENDNPGHRRVDRAGSRNFQSSVSEGSKRFCG
jgi:hypothetical protein